MGRAVLQLRRNTQAFWESVNITPASGEPIYALDTRVLKIGDGSTPYNLLPSISGTGGGGAGAAWHDDAGPPTSGLGANGDYYLNTINGDVWKKGAGSWVLTGNIKGPAGAQGAPGADSTVPGPQGPQGVQGPPGTDATYVHTQALPASTWVVPHNMGKRPSITIFDSANDEIEGDIVHNSVNQLTLTFSAAFSGVAYCN